ncbi:MAG: lysophospholipid acyltransferase family protein [Desulfuromusa sp.]|nr:lysophospholipid acyltransferase family protein [Desulfuromusa sp.]
MIPLLPRAVIIALANVAGILTFYFSKRERTIGLANLDIVLGDSKSPSEKKTILKKSLSSFAQTMLDIFWFSVGTEKRIRKYHRFVPENGPFFDKCAHVVITAHTGNWELFGISSAMCGIDMAGIAAEIKNHMVNKRLVTLRQRTGLTIIAREGAMRTLVSRLRNNEKTVFVLDQNVEESKGGIWVNFLGMPTLVSAAPAHLAYRTGTKIIFAFSHPVGGGKYETHTGQTITPPTYKAEQDKDVVIKALTQQIMDVVSAHIHEHPELWLWSYKHWKTVAPGDDPNNYPVYH